MNLYERNENLIQCMYDCLAVGTNLAHRLMEILNPGKGTFYRGRNALFAGSSLTSEDEELLLRVKIRIEALKKSCVLISPDGGTESVHFFMNNAGLYPDCNG